MIKGLRKTDYTEAMSFIEDLRENDIVQRMKDYTQHGRITTYKHCERVAVMSYYLNKKFHLGADNEVMLRAAMLHDFYLYDWHAEDNGEHNWHGYIHAKTAMKNAIRYFHIGKREQQIIYTHMWPLNITRVPRSREAWIVCLADKYISTRETLFERGRKRRNFKTDRNVTGRQQNIQTDRNITGRQQNRR